MTACSTQGRSRCPCDIHSSNERRRITGLSNWNADFFNVVIQFKGCSMVAVATKKIAESSFAFGLVYDTV